MIVPRPLPVFAILLTWILLAASILPAQEGREEASQYYKSNELGMALEEIGWYRRDEFPYILAVAKEAGRETRTLLHNGSQIRRWEISEREERIYGQSALEQLRRYDSLGRLAEEQSFVEGTLERRILFYYNGQKLQRTETFGSGGQLLYRDLYRLSQDGQLRRVTREQGIRQDDQELSLSGGGGSIAEERFGNHRDRRTNRYDPVGRLVQQEYRIDGRLIRQEHFQYRDESQVLLSSQLEEPPLQRLVRRSYDEEGRIISILVMEQGEEREQTTHRRDSRGRIVETHKRGARGIENWRFEYGPEDNKTREEYRLRGALERITLYQDQEGSRLEELYRGGRLFMRVYYEGEQKVKEEFIDNGEPVRVREYR